MIFHYIDESGTGVKDARSRYFVLASIAIDERDCPSFDASINQFKRVLIPWAEPEDFEIKGRDLRRGEKFFAKMSWPQRKKAILDLAELRSRIKTQLIDLGGEPMNGSEITHGFARSDRTFVIFA